ncbi:MAG: hypothetical protein KDD73_11040 [Anaerolineales bacterium]|nr:hypothetical protein [Anaerolineales bacterium]MCB9127840.1 leucine/isoleucine/valine transporter permease subunit [Ardenticatenales bacterium]MCB9172907.1 leucine/isoleucine/valine transporter permease subunit [Ardenticatenales bacterium]
MSATTSSPTSFAMRQRAQGKSPLRRAIDVGLIGSIPALLLALVGMVDAFSNRYLLEESVSTGQVMLAVVALIVGYLAARRISLPAQTVATKIGYGAVAGLMVGLVLALLLFIGEVVGINLRKVLVNASPALYEILAFNQAPAVGMLLLALMGTLLGALGGALFVMPARLRSAIITGITVIILLALLRDIVKLVFQQYEPTTALYRFLFTPNGGLTKIGLLLAFLLPAAADYVWSAGRPTLDRRYHALPDGTQKSVRWVGLAVAFILLLLFPTIFGRFPSEAMNNVILLGIMMGLGLNIVVGFAGMLDLGYVGFFAIGAYTMALLTSPQVGGGMNFWTALPFSLLASMIAGIILGIPVLKMRGDYLAIVTLGFGEIIRVLVLSDALRPWFYGAPGITGVPAPNVGGMLLNNPETLYYLLIAVMGLTLFISLRLRDSRLGRAWMAVREDEDVAEAMGINLVVTKLMAFATGATMAGLGGAIFAAKLGSIVPQTFNLLISVNALAVIIIGGMGSVPGVVVGALLLIGLPEVLREFAEYRLWVYGALLVAMMLFKPEGFWPDEGHRRELTEHDPEETPQAPGPADPPLPPGTVRDRAAVARADIRATHTEDEAGLDE